MTELYTMQRYLQYSTLVKYNLQHFDAWASTFGETVTSVELAPEGDKFRIKTRFARFNNIPELMTMFREIADIQTAETLHLPTPDVEKHPVAVPASQIQKDMVASLGERAEAIREGRVTVWEDNMLAITNEGRKLALDQRLINEQLPDDPNSKVNSCANNVYEIWEKTRENKSTQLVFCDLSTPKSLGTEDNPYEMEQVDGVWKLKERAFTDVYTDLKRKLVEKGIPPDEIAFIHEATSETKREEIFSKVRSGEIRILMGSTQKMGAGTNVQDKIIALHHLDCAWTPDALTQRNGRGIRRGNDNPLVHIYNYVTQGTFDAYMYETVERKQKFIGQIMTSKTPIRSMEDVDERALDYAIIKGVATGNPLMQEKTELETKTAKLKMLKQSYLSQKYDLEDMVERKYPIQIKECKENIEKLKEDSQYLIENTKIKDDNFSPMILNNQVYNERAKAGEKILELCKSVKDTKGVEIGTYRGFKMYLEFNTFEKVFQVALKNKMMYRAILGSDKIGVITRINNALESVTKTIADNQTRLENLQVQYKNAQDNLTIPFAQENELQESLARLKEVDKELKIGEIKESRTVEFDDEENADMEEFEDYSKNKKKEYVR